MSGPFIQSAVILLRESLEALLVLAALAAYLEKAGAGSRLFAMYIVPDWRWSPVWSLLGYSRSSIKVSTTICSKAW